MSHPFSYRIIYSSRKTIAIQVTRDGEVLVRSPRRCSRAYIDAFVAKNETWVMKHIAQAAKLKEREQLSPTQERPPLSQEERAHYIEIARDIFTRKTEYYARIMGISYNRISIREQKTRWGSCSSKGNLNFNWRLILAPETVLDYVVVHELAHRRQMNHSKAFYDIVAAVLPDYKEARRWLRDNGHTLWK